LLKTRFEHEKITKKGNKKGELMKTIIVGEVAGGASCAIEEARRAKNNHLRIVYCVMCILIIFLSSGCTGALKADYGRITPDRNAESDFKTYQVNPNYNYYLSGATDRPNAIIGLDKELTVEPTLWEKVELTPGKFRELVMGLNSEKFESKSGLAFSAFAMFDDKGKQIGVWYSLPEAKTTIRMKDDHTVIIFTPNIQRKD
jgi:hypothetical protein